MKILISNDDGINAVGIKALIEAVSVENEVYVMAPDRERSAAGHSLTLHTPLRVEEVEPVLGAKRMWVTTGTPGDCVKIAVNAVLMPEEQPDLVISGINHGPNLGGDVLYSGTVSAAMEGALLNVPALAISLASMTVNPIYFATAAHFVATFLPRIAEISFPKKTILNINTPALDKEDINGVAITRLGTRLFTDTYEKRLDPRGKTYYWLAGEMISQCTDEASDICAIRDNKISITPITFEITKTSIMPELENAFCKDGVCDWY